MKVVKGFIKCGVKNPFYNEIVLLDVLGMHTDRYGNLHVDVITVEEREFDRCLIDIRTSEVVEEWKEFQRWEGLLDTDKHYEVIE